MKKAFVFLFCIMMLSFSNAQEEYYIKSQESFTMGKKSFLRGKMYLPENIKTVEVYGPARLAWALDTASFIEYYMIVDDIDVSEPYWEGTTLKVDNKNKTIYLLHVTSDDVAVNLSNEADAFHFDSARQLDEFSKSMDKVAETSSMLSSSSLVKLTLTSVFKDMPSTVASLNESLSSGKDVEEILSESNSFSGKESTKAKKYDRTDLDFHWGFTNWGSNQFNGLIGLSDPGYDLRTSFSSYQLSYLYNVVMTDHFSLGLGLGYESDVYKFVKPYVAFANNTFCPIDTVGAFGYYTTRFVTRYVQLPVQIGWSSHANRHRGINIKVSAIPALGWCGKHTGLKHKLHDNGSNPQDQQNLKEVLNPYKLDVRLDVDFGGMGVFLQVATLPQFVEGAKIYPIKLGFSI